MEGFGERMKRAADSKFLTKKDIEPGYAVENDIGTGKFSSRVPRTTRSGNTPLNILNVVIQICIIAPVNYVIIN